MLSTLNIRGGNHEKCEDSIFVVDRDEYIIGGVFDGCSTGTHSHWASQTLAYLYQSKAKKADIVDDLVTRLVVNDMVAMMQTAGLNEMNFLSTALIFQYSKEYKQLYIRAFGDGAYYVNDEEHEIEFPNNAPDYLGYVLRSPDFATVTNYLKSYPIQVYHNVDSFRVCSDGTKALTISQFKDPQHKEPLGLLFQPPTSENYLGRMWNILKREGWTPGDDLSIISYVTDTTDKERDQA